MKHKSIIASAIGLSLLLLLIAKPLGSEPQDLPHTPEIFEPIPVIEPLPTVEILEPIPIQTKEQVEWMDKLIECESGGNAHALNPEDGGSRSVGILQFKDATFLGFSKQYGLGFSHEDIYNPESQKIVAHHMLEDGLEHQWMNCYRAINADYPNSGK